MLSATRALCQAVKMAATPPRQALIAIVGTTGTGKSKLAVDLALRFNGEVINGDAVQMYEGLPIITNKITHEEQQGVPHHLLGCIGIKEPTWTVEQFVKAASDTISDIHSRGRLPILVGGTHYYTQSLLLKGSLQSSQADNHQDAEAVQMPAETEIAGADLSILQASPEEMLEKLREVDPIMASRWHPRDGRKIRRSLEIYLKTGQRASDVYAEQQKQQAADRESAHGTSSDSGLRFPTLMLWTHTPRDSLVERLNTRVLTMYESGLLSEAKRVYELAQQLEAEGAPVDLTRGIYISIGYKEFLPLLRLQQEATDSNVEKAAIEKTEKECIEATQAATRRYAKYQLRWLRIKFLNALQDIDAHQMLYVLDTSDTVKWDSTVVEPSAQYVQLFLRGAEMPNTFLVSAAAKDTIQPLKDYDLSRRREMWRQRVCEACGVTAVTEEDWLKHIESRRHLKTALRKNSSHVPYERAIEQDDPPR